MVLHDFLDLSLPISIILWTYKPVEHDKMKGMMENPVKQDTKLITYIKNAYAR